MSAVLVAAALLALAPPLPTHLPMAGRELFPFDPVILIGTGEKLEGQVARESAYGNYRYRFATEASQRAFDAMPSRFAVAMGGGCARMGPLSGSGDVARFEVVGERLYIFASDACRESFLKAPKSFLEVADAPFPTDSRGIALAASVRRWLRADAACPREIVVWGARMERRGEIEHGVRTEVRLGPNLTFTELSTWDDSAWWTTATFGPADSRAPASNARRSNRQPEQPLDDDQFEAFRREAMWEPLFLARVLLQPDVKLAGGGEAEWKVGDAALTGEILRIHWRGVTVEWLVKPGSGQPVAQRAQRRSRDMRFAQVTESFSSWNDRGGVRVPLARTDGTAVRRFDAVDSECDAPAIAVPIVPEE
jgi:YHS domain-containing protein